MVAVASFGVTGVIAATALAALPMSNTIYRQQFNFVNGANVTVEVETPAKNATGKHAHDAKVRLVCVYPGHVGSAKLYAKIAKSHGQSSFGGQLLVGGNLRASVQGTWTSSKTAKGTNFFDCGGIFASIKLQAYHGSF
jgi:hypothetical protein